MKKQVLLFFLLIISVLFLTGCKKCPSSCYDGLECTSDYCSESTNFQCRHDPIPDCTCGDAVCDPELYENQCTCEVDCGQCMGEVSKYVEYKCVDDECITSLKPDIEVKKASKVNNYYLGAMNVNIKLDFEEPINTEHTLLQFTLRMDDMPTSVKNFKFTRALLKDDKNTFISELELDDLMPDVGAKTTDSLPFKGYAYDEYRSDSLQIQGTLELFYEYTEVYEGINPRTVRSSYQVQFGPLQFITAEAKLETD